MAYRLLTKDRIADADGCGSRGSGLMGPVIDAGASDLLVLSWVKRGRRMFRGPEGRVVGPFRSLRWHVGVLGVASDDLA